MISLTVGILIEVSKVFVQDRNFDFQPRCSIFLANIYNKLISLLRQAGYVRHKYSDYSRPNSNPVGVWTTMVQLAQILPPGKLNSTLIGLKMYYTPSPNTMDVTNL